MKCPNCGYDVPSKIKKVFPPENEPLSPWGYFGYQLLFSIPIVGFVLLIVFSCGGAHNKNLRNFARSYWCGLLIVAIVVIIAVVIALVCGLTVGSFTSEAGKVVPSIQMPIATAAPEATFLPPQMWAP